MRTINIPPFYFAPYFTRLFNSPDGFRGNKLVAHDMNSLQLLYLSLLLVTTLTWIWDTNKWHKRGRMKPDVFSVDQVLLSLYVFMPVG